MSFLEKLLGTLGLDLPEEPHATCEDCAMLGSDCLSFSPISKCCTFLPRLMNFQVGAALDDASSFGRTSVRERIARGAGVEPMGLMKTDAWREARAREDFPDRFGRDESLICPHFERSSGRCGVWQQRPALCQTWFCKYDLGVRSRAFWRSVLRFGTLVENDLAVWALSEVGDEAMCASVILVLHPDEGIPAPTDEWGGWKGREEAFYRACAERVSALTIDEVFEVCGPRVRLAAKAMVIARDSLERDPLGERLEVSPTAQVSVDGELAHLVGYSPYDPLEMPAEVVDVLKALPASPDDVIDFARQDLDLEIDRELLRLLWDFALIRDAPDQDSGING